MNMMIKYFDVLCIKNNNSDAEIVQALLSRHCLGSFLENNFTNLYFEGGAKSTIEKKLFTINSMFCVLSLCMLELTK